MILKKTISVMFMVFLLFVFTDFAVMAATTSIRVFVDGAEIQFPDQKPFINRDNRTLVPVRFISEALGAEVKWISETRNVKIIYKEKTILLEIGLKQAQVGASIVTMDTNAAIVNDRTMVPLRFVSECLGAEVEWVASEQAVYITTAESDQALVDSDLEIILPQPGNPNKIDLQLVIWYKWTTPLEPQLADLKELLEKRFGSEAQEIVDYVATKKEAQSRILPKDWVIDGKNIRVYDNVGSVSVTVWD